MTNLKNVNGLKTTKMTDTDRKEAIKEVLKWVKSGKQDLQNGAEEIDTINYIYAQDQFNVTLGNVSNNEVEVCEIEKCDLPIWVDLTVCKHHFLNHEKQTDC